MDYERSRIIFFMCSGVGHINRGYEVHMRELFDLISDKIPDTRFLLLKGAGDSSKNEKHVFCIKRNSILGYYFKRMFMIRPPLLELFTFFISSIYYIIKYKPKIIYCADYMLAAYLTKFKVIFGLKYLILFRNGNAYSPPYKHADFVHQILNLYHFNTSDFPNIRQFVIPHGFKVNDYFVKEESKYELRNKLKLPVNKKILLSVGALDLSVKRMDYIVNEFSKLGNDFFLLLIGNYEQETSCLEKMISQSITKDKYRILTLEHHEVINYYCAADFFCLASLKEGFGRVYVEASLCNLPVIAHDYEVPREVLGDLGFYSDLTKNGYLVNVIGSILNNYDKTLEKVIECKKYCKEKYDWDIVIVEYIKMFKILLCADCR